MPNDVPKVQCSCDGSHLGKAGIISMPTERADERSFTRGPSIVRPHILKTILVGITRTRLETRDAENHPRRPTRLAIYLQSGQHPPFADTVPAATTAVTPKNARTVASTE